MAEVNLGGWDVAYVMKYGDVNAGIASDIAAGRSAFPATLAVSAQSGRGVVITLGGVVEPWRLTSGGTGSTVAIGIHVSAATISGGDNDQTDGTIDVALAAPLAMASDGTVSIAAGTLQVTEVTLTFPISLTALERLGAQQAVATWAQQLGTSIAGALTRLDTTLRPSNPRWTWLVPQAAGVAVSEDAGETADAHRLVLVGMLSQSGGPGGTPAVANAGLPAGATVGYFMASGVFLEHVVLPGLSLLFDHADSSYFRIADGQIVQTQPLRYDQFVIADGGDAVQADVSNFTVSISGEVLRLSMSIAFPYKLVNVTSDFQVDMALSLANGVISATNLLVASPKTTVEANETLATTEWLGPLIVAIVAAVASGVARVAASVRNPVVAAASASTVQLDAVQVPGEPPVPGDAEEAVSASAARANGAARLVRWARAAPVWQIMVGGGVLASLLATGVPQVIKAIQSGEAEDIAAQLDEFLKTALAPAALPASLGTTFELSSAGINGAFVLGAKAKAS